MARSPAIAIVDNLPMREGRQKDSTDGGKASISQYLTTTHAGSWVVLVLALAVVICGAVWMATGTLKMTMPIVGVNEGGKLTFYVSPDEAVQMGMTSGKISGQSIELDGEEIGVVTGYVCAMSKEEILAEYDNLYITQQLDLGEKNVVFSGDLYSNTCADGVMSAYVVTAETTPLKLLLGEQASG